MKVKEFLDKLNLAADVNTCYVQGGFGCRLKSPNGDWYSTSYSWNKKNKAVIQAHTNTDPTSMGFDCVCLIKAVAFWGWTGDLSKPFGGSVYDSKNDIPISKFAKSCADLSTDWTVDPEEGELVFYDKGMTHIGVYVGDGIVVEATPAWACGVQRTLLPNRLNPNAIPVREWYAHGHSSYIEYEGDKWKKAYEKLSAAYGELEAENRRIRATIDTIKGLVNDYED